MHIGHTVICMELAPFRIKVTRSSRQFDVGRFGVTPLMVVRVLDAGKVPGAKTIDDVKEVLISTGAHEKGGSPEDVTKGALYLMDQRGETGQALPITGAGDAELI